MGSSITTGAGVLLLPLYTQSYFLFLLSFFFFFVYDFMCGRVVWFGFQASLRESLLPGTSEVQKFRNQNMVVLEKKEVFLQIPGFCIFSASLRV